MTRTYSIAALVSSIVLTSFVVFALFAFAPRSNASSAPGLGATVSSSTIKAVSSTASIVSATSTYTCAARVISTQGSAVMLTFTQAFGETPTGSYGSWQPASTTVAYDSGLYGCNAISAYSYTAQNIMVTITQ